MSEDRGLYIKIPKLTDEQLSEIEKLKREGGVISVMGNYAAPIPCVRDEHGEIREQTVKALIAKVDEELNELKSAILAVINLEDVPDDMPTGIFDFIADEACDTITSITTMLEALGIDEDMRAKAQMRVNEKNRERGRLA